MAHTLEFNNISCSGLLVEDLSKSWREHRVFTGISFCQPLGTIYGIAGDNGAGKSTLLKILASVLSADSGTISFNGVSLQDLPAWRSLIGYVPQELALDGQLTVRENVKFWSSLRGLDADIIRGNLEIAANDPLVADFLDKQIRKCSGGMARRASLVVGLLGAPQLLLLDEPFAGADKGSRALMLERLNALRTDGRTILITSHEQGTLEQISDRILYLQQGQIVEQA
ncbi:MAG: ATP-binding cassette domain-containing protein [Saccharofermentanales bacterium]